MDSPAVYRCILVVEYGFGLNWKEELRSGS